jgi:hypothetical protein
MYQTRKTTAHEKDICSNLSFSTKEAALRWLFEAYGLVASVNVVTDQDTGPAKGFGFVDDGRRGGSQGDKRPEWQVCGRANVNRQ